MKNRNDEEDWEKIYERKKGRERKMISKYDEKKGERVKEREREITNKEESYLEREKWKISNKLWTREGN